MAKVFYPPACDAKLLSAYRDEVLNAAEQRLVDLHLAACPACRQELLHHERLSAGLRHLAGATVPRPLPSTFVRRSSLRTGPRQPIRPTSTLLRASLAAALAIVVLVERAPQRPASLFEAYPANGASDVSTDTSIVITFQQPVNQAQIQRTLQFQPPISFGITWETAQRADVVPVLPLAPSTTYTLLAAVPTAPAATIPAPQTPPPIEASPETLTVFQTAPRSVTEGGPQALIPRAGFFTRGQPASISQAVLAVPATPSPVGLPGATLPINGATAPSSLAATSGTQALARVAPSTLPVLGAAGPTASRRDGSGEATTLAADALAQSMEQPALLPPCAPANIFTPIYTSRGDVRSALGCVLGTTRSTALVSQDFQRGELLATLPDDVLYELTTDGIWRASPLGAAHAGMSSVATPGNIGPAFQRYWQTHQVLSSSLGQPLAPEVQGQGVLQPFTHGFMLATDGWTYIADDAGQWQRLVSLLPASDNGPSNGGAITGGVASFPPLHLPPAKPTCRRTYGWLGGCSESIAPS